MMVLHANIEFMDFQFFIGNRNFHLAEYNLKNSGISVILTKLGIILYSNLIGLSKKGKL